MKKNNIITVLDIGSTKVCCCIAALSIDGHIDILGIGNCACFGIKSGIVTNMEYVGRSIVKAVEMAERMAKMSVKSVLVSVSGKNVKSRIIGVSTHIGGRVIRDEDVIQLLSFRDGENDHCEIVHAIPIMYSLDSLHSIKNPVGMVAYSLTANINFITVPAVQLNNLLLCVSKCHLEPIGVVSSCYASGLFASNNEDSRQIVIDFGGETTSIAFIYNGVLCGFEVIPIGGRHITRDVAYGLNISIPSAERLKTLYGAAFVSIDDERSFILAPVLEDENVIDLQQIPRSALNRIIQPRTEEILQSVRKKIEESEFKHDFRNSSITITGGASQLTGIRDFTGEILNKQIKIKENGGYHNTTHLQIGGDSSVAIGMIKFAQLSRDFRDSGTTFKTPHGKIGFFKKALIWLENNL
ncbi:MAG: cell division protein FtsA [Holosporaceae bacterium]|nr:cell division protein FtsA [Holosporaceae bacterium]